MKKSARGRITPGPWGGGSPAQGEGEGKGKEAGGTRTLAHSQAGRPTLFASASLAMPAKRRVMCGGAGTRPGRACGAAMSCLRAGESLDMVGAVGGVCAREWWVVMGAR